MMPLFTNGGVVLLAVAVAVLIVLACLAHDEEARR